MRVLLDTNLLARLLQRDHSQHEVARRAVRSAPSRGCELFIVPQILYELWVVCTRPPSQNGLGLTVAETHLELAMLRRLVTVRRDERAIFSEWQRLVTAYDVKGKSAHDARLVAAMLRHGLTHILTFNSDDFRRYKEIDVLRPDSIVTDTGGR